MARSATSLLWLSVLLVLIAHATGRLANPKKASIATSPQNAKRQLRFKKQLKNVSVAESKARGRTIKLAASHKTKTDLEADQIPQAVPPCQPSAIQPCQPVWPAAPQQTLPPCQPMVPQQQLPLMNPTAAPASPIMAPALPASGNPLEAQLQALRAEMQAMDMRLGGLEMENQALKAQIIRSGGTVPTPNSAPAAAPLTSAGTAVPAGTTAPVVPTISPVIVPVASVQPTTVPPAQPVSTAAPPAQSASPPPQLAPQAPPPGSVGNRTLNATLAAAANALDQASRNGTLNQTMASVAATLDHVANSVGLPMQPAPVLPSQPAPPMPGLNASQVAGTPPPQASATPGLNVSMPTLPPAPAALPAPTAPGAPVAPATTEALATTAAPAQLPPGWEQSVNSTGRTYYVDHNTKSTHWEAPTAPVAPTATPPATGTTAVPPPPSPPPPTGTQLPLGSASGTINVTSYAGSTTVSPGGVQSAAVTGAPGPDPALTPPPPTAFEASATFPPPPPSGTGAVGADAWMYEQTPTVLPEEVQAGTMPHGLPLAPPPEITPPFGTHGHVSMPPPPPLIPLPVHPYDETPLSVPAYEAKLGTSTEDIIRRTPAPGTSVEAAMAWNPPADPVGPGAAVMMTAHHWTCSCDDASGQQAALSVRHDDPGLKMAGEFTLDDSGPDEALAKAQTQDTALRKKTSRTMRNK